VEACYRTVGSTHFYQEFSMRGFILSFIVSLVCCASKATRVAPGAEKALVRVAQNVQTFPQGADKEMPQLKRFVAGDVTLNAWSRDFARGSAILLEFESAENLAQAELLVNDRPLALSRSETGVFALFANSPDSRLKQNRVVLKRPGAAPAEFTVPVVRKEYPVAVSKMTVNKFSNQSKPMSQETINFIEEGRKKKLRALVSSQGNLLTGDFRYPRDEHKITSPFFIKRVYERFKLVKGKKKKLPGKTSYHGGTDLKGQKGAPIFAIADGVVNLAEPLYYEGNIVIIDHGNGVISGYMHQSELLVKQGEKVKAGQLIGRSGDTGMVTGPHLHIFLLIHGIKADPLSLLTLPVRPAR
jgi:murein DD-endopeptidase MepM/ murein hydrolase activator NlpD